MFPWQLTLPRRLRIDASPFVPSTSKAFSLRTPAGTAIALSFGVYKPECATEAQDYSRRLEVEEEISDRSDVRTQEIPRLKEEENVAI